MILKDIIQENLPLSTEQIPKKGIEIGEDRFPLAKSRMQLLKLFLEVHLPLNCRTLLLSLVLVAPLSSFASTHRN